MYFKDNVLVIRCQSPMLAGFHGWSLYGAPVASLSVSELLLACSNSSHPGGSGPGTGGCWPNAGGCWSNAGGCWPNAGAYWPATHLLLFTGRTADGRHRRRAHLFPQPRHPPHSVPPSGGPSWAISVLFEEFYRYGRTRYVQTMGLNRVG